MHDLRDVGRVVADPLDILGAEEKVRAEGDVPRVLHHVGEQLAEQRGIHRVDLVVPLPDRQRAIEVTRGIGVENLLELGKAHLGDMLDTADQTLRGEIPFDRENPLGRVLGHIPDPLEIIGDVDRGNDFAQILGHRLAPRDHPRRFVLDLALELVHALVDADDPLGERLVAAGQGRHRVADLLLRHAAHFGDLLRERIQFVVEGSDDVLLVGHDRSVAQPKRPVM